MVLNEGDQCHVFEFAQFSQGSQTSGELVGSHPTSIEQNSFLLYFLGDLVCHEIQF